MLIRIHAEPYNLELKGILENIFPTLSIFTWRNFSLQGFKGLAQGYRDVTRGTDLVTWSIPSDLLYIQSHMLKRQSKHLKGKKKEREYFLSLAFFYMGGYLSSFEFNRWDWLNDIYWAASLLCNWAAAPWYHFEVPFSESIQLSWNFKNSSDPLKFFKTPLRMMYIKRFKLNNYGH